LLYPLQNKGAPDGAPFVLRGKDQIVPRGTICFQALTGVPEYGICRLEVGFGVFFDVLKRSISLIS
jgi:hypothetical protein